MWFVAVCPTATVKLMTSFTNSSAGLGCLLIRTWQPYPWLMTAQTTCQRFTYQTWQDASDSSQTNPWTSQKSILSQSTSAKIHLRERLWALYPVALALVPFSRPSWLMLSMKTGLSCSALTFRWNHPQNSIATSKTGTAREASVTKLWSSSTTNSTCSVASSLLKYLSAVHLPPVKPTSHKS